MLSLDSQEELKKKTIMSCLLGRQSDEVNWDIWYGTSNNLSLKYEWCFLLLSLAFFSKILNTKMLIVTNSLSNMRDSIMLALHIIRAELQVWAQN